MQINAPNRMRENMALSTTQSIWRSGGGDTTRTAYCGSGEMIAQFYIADASVATDTKVTVSSAAGAPALILPAGAVVTGLYINAAGTGHVDIGTLGYNSGTETSAAIGSNVAVGAVGSITAGLTLAPSTELAYVTAIINTDGAGTVGGYVRYFVVDPLAGQQNV